MKAIQKKFLNKYFSLTGLCYFAIYYFGSFVMEMILNSKTSDLEMKSYCKFDAICFALLFLSCSSSVILIIKKSEFYHLGLMISLAGATAFVFNSFKTWLQIHCWPICLEWLFNAALIAYIFLWWTGQVRNQGMQPINSNEPIPNQSLIEWQLPTACLCFTSLVFCNAMLTALTILLIKHFIMARTLALTLNYFCSFFLFVILAIYYSGVFDLTDFFARFGFAKPKPKIMVFAILIGSMIGIFAVSLANSRLVLPPNRIYGQFHIQPSLALNCLLLVVPVIEEVVIRGYLYPAFRNTLNYGWCLLIICGIALFTHLDVFCATPVGFLPIMFINLAATVLKENYKTIWCCIACDVVYDTICLFS
jgi:membrane protease YdiL (CAAX protease family)